MHLTSSDLSSNSVLASGTYADLKAIRTYTTPSVVTGFFSPILWLQASQQIFRNLEFRRENLEFRKKSLSLGKNPLLSLGKNPFIFMGEIWNFP